MAGEHKAEKQKAYATAIVLAAGQGKRMGTKIQKQYLELDGKPVLYYSLRCFEDSGQIDRIILVTGEGQEEYCRKEIVEKYGFHKVRAIVAGGKERYHSVWNGLQCAVQMAAEAKEARERRDTDPEYVFIHDGARPFVDEEMLCGIREAVEREEACVAGMPVKDTIKIADDNQYAKVTPERKYVWMVQTPQAFSLSLICQAYGLLMQREKQGETAAVTDDAMVVEMMTGHPVKLVKGSYENIKITTPEDLAVAELFVKHHSERKI